MTAGDRLRLASLGLHPDRVRTLLVEWGSAGAVLRAVTLGQIEVTDSVRERLSVDAEQSAEDAGASVVLRDGLPEGLASLPDAPDLLYVRGELPPEAGVAIVGTRSCTTYGLRLGRTFGRAVAEAGWPVISGLARGIDGAAHIGCLDGGGVGVAVLGCGIDVAYPPEHARLAARLLDCSMPAGPLSPNTHQVRHQNRGDFRPEIVGTYMRIWDLSERRQSPLKDVDRVLASSEKPLDIAGSVRPLTRWSLPQKAFTRTALMGSEEVSLAGQVFRKGGRYRR